MMYIYSSLFPTKNGPLHDDTRDYKTLLIHMLRRISTNLCKTVKMQGRWEEVQ